MLRAPVDLLWNGGIGTYVKASGRDATPTSATGPTTACASNGDELRCRIVAEGGNLGLTQLGRVEYALAGGLVNTDAIDNSAGVDCSDHEVNIKILLDAVVAGGELTGRSSATSCWRSMTDEVAELVLDNNRAQTLALLIARRQALPMVNVHARYIDVLEDEGWLDRALEFLPTDKQIAERQASGAGLQTPEFAVLIAYTKNANVAEMVRSDLPDDAVARGRPGGLLPGGAARALRRRDPRPPAAARDHRHPGREPDGQPVGDLVRPPDDGGHRRVGGRRHQGLGRRPRDLRLRRLWAEIDELDGRCRSTSSSSCSSTAGGWSSGARCGCCATAARRSTSPPPSPSSGPGIAELATTLEPALAGRMAGVVHSGEASRSAAGVPEELAERAGVWPLLHTGFDLVEVADGTTARGGRRGPGPLGDVRPARPARGCGTASARCRAPTAGRPRPARRCATIC